MILYDGQILMVDGEQHPRAGKIKLVAPAVTYDGQRMEVRLPPPWLSEHTEEVGSNLKYLNTLTVIYTFRSWRNWDTHLKRSQICGKRR